MSSEKQRFAKRLNEVLSEAGLSKLGAGRQSQFAKKIDVQSNQAGKWLKGEEFPPTSVLVKIAKTYNTRSNWLLSGSGEKYENKKHKESWIPESLEKRGKLNKEAFSVAMAWMKLGTSKRKIIKDLINEFSTSDK